MKRFHKLTNWLLLVSLLLSNSPILYAEELHQAFETSQAEERYDKALEEAKESIVSEEITKAGVENVENPSLDESGDKKSKESEGDAIQQPKVMSDINPEEEALKAQYGAPVAVSGQEQLFRIDETHFVTYIGSDIKTYKDDNGVEVPVDLSLYSYHADGKQYYLPKESPVGVALPSEVTSETPIDISHAGDKISLFPLDKPYGQATVAENAILYNNVDGKTDVQYTVQSNGVKEEIVLAQWEGKNRFTYGLDAGRYDVSLENNQVLVREKGTDKLLFNINAPLMADSSGQTSTALTLDLGMKGNHYLITVTASEDWLASSERVYPVRIDPTVTIPREKILDSTTSTVHGQYQGVLLWLCGLHDQSDDWCSRSQGHWSESDVL